METLPFDELARLWAEEPEKAEEYHRAVIDDFILGLPEEKQEKARKMMWRINTKAATFTDPMQRLNYVFGAMWESFLDFNNVLNYPIEREETRPKAKVLDFKPPSDI